MTYESLQLYSQIVAGFIFLGVLAGVAIYAFWPANKERFDRAARIPLDNGQSNERR